MAQIGQIIYNVQDYVNSGGYISTSNSNLNQTISSFDGQEQYDAKKIDIFTTNIVERYSSKQFTRLGIQAPPGTRAILNTDKTILIGQNGIYELDEDIIITSLVFVRPRHYIKDEDATNIALNNGMKAIQKAEEDRAVAIANLEETKDPTTKEYWEEYSNIQSAYDQAYQPALDEFNDGLNGIYELDSDNPYQDLYNIIIDFIY